MAHTGEKFSVCEQEQENPKHQSGAASSWYSGHNRALKSLVELSYFPQAKVQSWISNINAGCIFLFFFSPCNYSVCLRKKKGKKEREKTGHLPRWCHREACWCQVHWRNRSKSLHLCGNILLVKGWAYYPRNGDMRFAETGWTCKPFLPPNFYLFLINWCHLVSLNCAMFPSFVFRWAWFNCKCVTGSHRALS